MLCCAASPSLSDRVSDHGGTKTTRPSNNDVHEDQVLFFYYKCQFPRIQDLLVPCLFLCPYIDALLKDAGQIVVILQDKTRHFQQWHPLPTTTKTGRSSAGNTLSLLGVAQQAWYGTCENNPSPSLKLLFHSVDNIVSASSVFLLIA